MDPRYPAGKFENPKEVTPAARKAAIEEIASAPTKVRAAVHGLNDSQLDTPYREGGWTVRQVVHHLADSHMNAYIRWRLALKRRSGPNWKMPRMPPWRYRCVYWTRCTSAG